MSGSLADPPGSSAIAAAALWVQGTLLGTVATAVAVIAVASVGVMMLAGRINVRRGATVIAGVFILFGASSIATGIRSSVDLDDAVQEPPFWQNVPSPVAEPGLPGAEKPYDPYAGASAPVMQ